MSPQKLFEAGGDVKTRPDAVFDDMYVGRLDTYIVYTHVAETNTIGV